MVHIDEIPTPYCGKYCTVTLATAGDGEVYWPMILFTGVLQLENPVLEIEIVIDGIPVRVHVVVGYTETHYTNGQFYAEYLKCVIAPNMPPADCCDDIKCVNRLIIHDEFKGHYTDDVEKVVEQIPHALVIGVPSKCTPYVAPNVGGAFVQL